MLGQSEIDFYYAHVKMCKSVDFCRWYTTTNQQPKGERHEKAETRHHQPDRQVVEEQGLCPPWPSPTQRPRVRRERKGSPAGCPDRRCQQQWLTLQLAAEVPPHQFNERWGNFFPNLYLIQFLFSIKRPFFLKNIQIK